MDQDVIKSRKPLTPEEQSKIVAELCNTKYEVLDDGFVKLVDVMGGDHSICQAARVSYGAGTKTVSDDSNLIRYLLRHRHTTPFEMVEFKFHVRVPMDCWRQWIRHRTASVNEYSTRYSEAIDKRQVTSPDEWRAQSQANRQGSATMMRDLTESANTEYYNAWLKAEKSRAIAAGEEEMGVGQFLSDEEEELHYHVEKVYDRRIILGVAREQARKDLTLSTYTEAYWKIDLHNLIHFLSLRMDPHAQLEIRSYANAIGKIVEKVVPVTWGAFEDYRLNAVNLTVDDVLMIRLLLAMGVPTTWITELTEEHFLQCIPDSLVDWKKKRCRERDECLAKLRDLGVIVEG